MFDVPTFLMRWLFLSNLLRDLTEIQTMPYQSYQPPSTHLHHEDYWRDYCIRGILSYPPGSQRVAVMEALRVELVQQLAQTLQHSDDVLQKCAIIKTRQNLDQTMSSISQHSIQSKDKYDDGDPYEEADKDIIRAFQDASNLDRQQSSGKLSHLLTSQRKNRDSRKDTYKDEQKRLVISQEGTNIVDEGDGDDDGATNLPVVEVPSATDIISAKRVRTDIRQYLPQLVAAVLKSPSIFDPNLLNPVLKLRQLILRRCLQDPSWGIDLCWLLEAEVGRAWKTLFEHRQQTGRRLIVVLPAEKAAVLAKIGTEKRETFELLQDAEQATAYGYTNDYDPQQPLSAAVAFDENSNEHVHHPSRLPSSLSLRRCSHFGDTMHFIDRLTKISLDLRHVPINQRSLFLQESLHELNRRIRRRMVTHGDVSLDVEDGRSPHDWPSVHDLSTDKLKFSVHFPLAPQVGRWPSGDEGSLTSMMADETPSTEVVRVLNIVASESRMLSSRERCPFLVHLEVMDSGLEGSDARLYAHGPNLGVTMEEALGMSPQASAAAASRREAHDLPSYHIPDELSRSRSGHAEYVESKSTTKDSLPRGGWQADQPFYPDYEGGYHFPDAYNDVRQQQFEELHQLMYLSAPSNTVQPLDQDCSESVKPHASFGHQLLDNVFGQPWLEKCQEIRQGSPYGHIKGWRLASFIMKAGEDIRREALVMQIISKLHGWFQEEIPESYRPYMRPYTIMCVGGDAGLVECLSDAKSVDEVKKETDQFVSLRDYFERAYGPPSASNRARGYGPPASPADGSISFDVAQDNFLRSLVGYSLVCYVLQIKDRHNANILLDRQGHVMHIDFGFVLGDTPKMGKVPIFSERAPFKLSQEFWDVLGGWNINQGGLGVRFCKMFELAFACASRHADELASMVEAAMLSLNTDVRYARTIAMGVRNRLRMRGPPNSVEQKHFIMDLVDAALTSWGTTTYDWLQRSMNGYQ